MIKSRFCLWRLKILLPIIFILGGGLFFLFKEDTYVPKPYGHPRIVLPAHEYVKLPNDFPYSFEISKCAVIAKNDRHKDEPFWINIYYPDFEAEIQLTYKSVKNDSKLLKSYFRDSYKLTSKHQVRAYSIQESIIKTPQDYPVVFVELFGQVPSQVQFYTTDGSKHFLRGALYFNTATQNDYLEPIIEFIKEDIKHLISTLYWKK